MGFAQEGALRERNVERGRHVDVVWFGVLREEWEARARSGGPHSL
jgi:RimJ/RimL family protein N-acetyltransferase